MRVSFLARVSFAHKVDARTVLFPTSPLVAFRSPARVPASNSTIIAAPASAELVSPGMSEDAMLAEASPEGISPVTAYEDRLNDLSDEPTRLVRVSFKVCAVFSTRSLVMLADREVT